MVLWGTDWKFCHEGNCSASQDLLSDAEQLPEWRNFRFAPKNHYGCFFLHTFPSTIAFRLEYVLFYQFFAKIATFFLSRKVQYGSSLIRWRRNVWRKLTWKLSYWRHVRRHFLAPVGFREILIGYARNLFLLKVLNHVKSSLVIIFLIIKNSIYCMSGCSSLFEPPYDKTNKMACAPSKDSDQHGHPPSLIRVFAVRMKKAWVLSYPLSAQWRLWSDWADAQADLSLCWEHMPFCWFCHEVAHFTLFQLQCTCTVSLNKPLYFK